MKKEIEIPRMGESISTAVIGEFLKTSGSFVEEGEEIVELETEKVNQALYAPCKGIVNWKVKAGDTVSVGEVIGFIDSEAKEPLKLEPKEPSKPIEPKTVSAKISQEPSKPITPKAVESQESKRAVKGSVLKSESKKSVTPSRLTKKQFVEEMFEKQAPKKEKDSPFIRTKMSSIRKTIARRLVDSLHQSAMLTTFNEVDMSQVIALRTKYQDSFMQKHGVKLGFMSFFVKAVLEALKEFPLINAFIEGEEIVQRTTYDIGIAIGGAKGLVVPVLRNCDHLSFANIEKMIVEFAKKAKTGKLQISDLQGGGFTITNGGVYGSLLSTPILNPPQSGILGMHNIVQRPIVLEDKIVARPMMYLALSYDHRIVDGREAVLFLVKIKEVIEDPSRLLFFEKENLQ